MSRNLAQTDCYFCHGEVKLTGEKRQVVKDDCGVYFAEYEGMIVADAECGDCEAKYLAWVDESKRVCYRRTPDPARLFEDLSFRSTFNDEPGEEDMPKYKIRETITRERIGAFVTGHPWPYLEKGEARTTSDITAITNEREHLKQIWGDACEHVAEACEMLGGETDKEPLDTWKLRELVARVVRERDEALATIADFHKSRIRKQTEREAAMDAEISRLARTVDRKDEQMAELQERIAGLEAALRETLIPLKALQLADGHNWSPAVREQFAKAEPMALAALSPAPAQEKKSDG